MNQQGTSPIVIVAGSPGTGKTTLAAHLARATPYGLHLPSDVFYTFPAHPIAPHEPAAHDQNMDIIIALTRTAAAFASRGYDVFLDGIFGPWFLPVVVTELRLAEHSAEYVVLRVPLETALERVRSREGPGRDHVVRQMHENFSDLGPYAGHAIDTADRTVDEIAVEFRVRQGEGVFALDLQSETCPV
jgi:cytidylate kinase